MRKTLFAVLAVVQVAVVGGLAWLFLRSGPAPRATPVMPPPMVADPSPTLAVRGDTVLHESPADGRADPAAGPHVELAHADRATVDPAPPLPPVAARPPADGPPVAPAAVPGKPRLAILPFKVDRPTPDQVGEQMADYFAGQITTDKYDLFERGQLSALVSEARLQQTSMFEPGTAMKLAHAQFVLIGHLSQAFGEQGKYQLDARVVGLDGRIVERGAVTFDFQRQYDYQLVLLAKRMHFAPADAPAPPPFDGLRDAINPQATIHVTIRDVDPKPVYHAGDRLNLEVVADQDCYLTLISYVDNNGVQLVPNKWVPSGRVRANERVAFPPPPPHTFTITFDRPPYGKDVFRVIATKAPLDIGISREGMENVPPTEDLTVPPQAARKLLDLDPEAWATDSITIVSEAAADATAGRPPQPAAGTGTSTGSGSTPPPPARPDPAGAAAAEVVDPNQDVLSEWQQLTGGQSALRGLARSPISLGSLGRYGADEALVIPVDGGGAKGVGGGGRLLGPIQTVKVGGVGLKGVGDDGGAADALARLRKPGTVVVPNLRLRAYDTPAATRLFAVQWALHNRFKPGADVNWDAIADRVATAPTPLIGLVDSGIDLDDDRLRPTAWTNPRPGEFDGCAGDLHGWNFVTATNVLFAPGTHHSHGSVCASIIAGRPTGRADDVIGICPTARLVTAVGLMSPAGTDGQPTGNLSSVLRSIAYCAQEGAQVINLSLGGPVSDDDLAELQKLPLWDELERRNVILVCAAGNDYQDVDAHPVFPACLKRPNIVCVMAVDAAGRLATDRAHSGKWEPFSNYGKTSVHLAAPGTQILGIPSHDGVGLETGTSFAAPIVTGTVALIQGRHPDWDYRQVIKALLGSVRPVPELRDRCSTGGVVNVGRALD